MRESDPSISSLSLSYIGSTSLPRCSTYNAKLEELRATHSTELESLSTNHAHELSTLRDSHTNEISTLGDQHSSRLLQLEQEIEELKSSQQEGGVSAQEAENKLRQLEAEHEAAIAELKTSGESERSRLTSSHESGTEELKREHDASMEKLRQDHEEQLLKIREEVEAEVERRNTERVEAIQKQLEGIRSELAEEKSKWQGEKEQLQQEFEVSCLSLRLIARSRPESLRSFDRPQQQNTRLNFPSSVLATRTLSLRRERKPSLPSAPLTRPIYTNFEPSLRHPSLSFEKHMLQRSRASCSLGRQSRPARRGSERQKFRVSKSNLTLLER